MNGLYLHTGERTIDRQQLGMVPTPPPMGRHHHPYPFVEFVDSVADNLQTVGFKIEEESYITAANDRRFFGLMEVKPIFDDKNRDYGMIVGLRGSHDQSIPRGLVAGSRVFVCSNLAFSGEIKVSTKQTTNVERRMAGLVYDAVRNMQGVFEIQDRRFDTYKEFELKPRWGDAAITELVRRQVINPSQVGRVIREWDEPSHDEHLNDGHHTVWTMHNAVTEALKMPVDERGVPARAGAPMAMERTVGLTQFLDEIVGFKLAA